MIVLLVLVLMFCVLGPFVSAAILKRVAAVLGAAVASLGFYVASNTSFDRNTMLLGWLIAAAIVLCVFRAIAWMIDPSA